MSLSAPFEDEFADYVVMQSAPLTPTNSKEIERVLRIGASVGLWIDQDRFGVAIAELAKKLGDDISTSYGSDNLARGIFGAANTPTTGAGTSCSTTALDNCVAPIDTFTPGLTLGSLSGSADKVLFTGHGGTTAANLWNVVDNNGVHHRD